MQVQCFEHCCFLDAGWVGSFAQIDSQYLAGLVDSALLSQNNCNLRDKLIQESRQLTLYKDAAATSGEPHETSIDRQSPLCGHKNTECEWDMTPPF